MCLDGVPGKLRCNFKDEGEANLAKKFELQVPPERYHCIDSERIEEIPYKSYSPRPPGTDLGWSFQKCSVPTWVPNCELA